MLDAQPRTAGPLDLLGCHPRDRVDDYLGKGWWHAETMLDLFDDAVERRGDEPAVTDPANLSSLTGATPESVTWRQLNERADDLATTLWRNGIRAGDVVAMWLPNTVTQVAAYFALWRLGVTATPMPMAYGRHELSTVLARSGARAVITVGAFGDSAPAEVASGGDILVFATGTGLPEGVIDLGVRPGADDVGDMREYRSHIRHTVNDRITICWTSGTEAAPKGVPRCHGDWLAVGHGVQDGISVAETSVVLNPFPLVNMAGFAGSLMPWLIGGAHLVQHQPLDLAVFLGQIERYRATHTIMAPAILTLLLQRAELRASVDLSSLRTVGSGGSALPPGVVRAWQDDLGVEVTNFFGSNEGVCLMGTYADTPDPTVRAQHLPNYGYRGREWTARLAAHTEVALVDPRTGERVTTPGGIGELRIAGPTVFAGYLGGTEAADPFDADGMLRSGDVFELCAPDGEYLRFVERSKEIIVRGGMNIAPAEVEGLLIDHPGIADAAVVGYDDPVMGEKCCAVVVPAPGADVTLESVRDFLTGRGVAGFKIPERLELAEALPRNPVGKLLRRRIKESLS
ncbi:class I adenylate-forming enzyme family protein [Nocardia puris]|uniref:Acyl-CoA synthetase (AMP-forming)/AMP-acid ligase II n=1 Tax=Nocardia puris TaxID=208602 RepID=A0A366E2M2_9NOCA|nr:class I adenylate-forming enzyme family protein [Nocardia puris]RBO96583.1 acyl-CoA synthetase (AMP-forming)/AMP-acid ligase II [Nocardia puris]